jgi:hypothetical protein
VQLEELHLARNLLDDEGMKNLSTYIINIACLEVLDISGNVVAEKSGVKSLALKNAFTGILHHKHHLRKLSIAYNRGIANENTMSLLQQMISESSSMK